MDKIDSGYCMIYYRKQYKVRVPIGNDQVSLDQLAKILHAETRSGLC